jgi:hypothetical protein
MTARSRTYRSTATEPRGEGPSCIRLQPPDQSITRNVGSPRVPDRFSARRRWTTGSLPRRAVEIDHADTVAIRGVAGWYRARLGLGWIAALRRKCSAFVADARAFLRYHRLRRRGACWRGWHAHCSARGRESGMGTSSATAHQTLFFVSWERAGSDLSRRAQRRLGSFELGLTCGPGPDARPGGAARGPG